MMSELEKMQTKFSKLSDVDWKLLFALNDCMLMLENECDSEPIRAFLQMAINFYGKARVVQLIDKCRFEVLKEFL